MSWAGISSNQCVSCNNLQDAVNTGVFTLKNAIPATTKQITKTEAANYVNLNTAYAPFASKASNQLVVKSNLQACVNLPYSYTLYVNYSDGNYVAGVGSSSAACALTTAFTVYSSSSTIGVGTTLYVDSCGLEQLYANYYGSSLPYYKIGTSYITFESWDGTSYGYQVRTIAACGSTSSATIDWSVGNQSGGNLTIFNNAGTQLLNVNSSAGSSQSGTLTIPYTQLPYTVRGSWVSGSGNIIKYRICDFYGGEVFYSGPITVGDYLDYTPSPTPVYVTVYLRANNVNPPVCPV
jgi:hypothetical protein